MRAVKNLIRSFYYAFKGILGCIKTCRNFRIHMVATAYVLYFSRYFELGSAEYAVLFLTFGSVLAAEAVNSALEFTCDAVTGKYSDDVRRAKDSAAAAVLISAVFAVCVAVSLFAKPDIIASVVCDIASSAVKIAVFIFTVVVSVIFIFYKEILNNGKK